MSAGGSLPKETEGPTPTTTAASHQKKQRYHHNGGLFLYIYIKKKKKKKKFNKNSRGHSSIATACSYCFGSGIRHHQPLLCLTISKMELMRGRICARFDNPVSMMGRSCSTTAQATRQLFASAIPSSGCTLPVRVFLRVPEMTPCLLMASCIYSDGSAAGGLAILRDRKNSQRPKGSQSPCSVRVLGPVVAISAACSAYSSVVASARHRSRLGRPNSKCLRRSSVRSRIFKAREFPASHRTPREFQEDSFCRA